MKWDLFVSDIFARFIGAVGLVAAMPWIVYCFTQVKFSGMPIESNFAIGISAFLVTLSLLFLLPNVHDRFVRITRPGFLRFLIVIVALAWVIVAIFGLRDQYLLSRMLDAPPVTTYVIATMAGLLCLGYVLLVAPFALAWREPRREHALRMEQKAIAAAATETERRNKSQIVGSELGSSATPLPPTRRPADLMDKIVSAPYLIAFAAIIYAFKFDTTVQTAALDAQLDGMWVVGTLIATALLFGPACLHTLIRGAPHNPKATLPTWLAWIIGPPFALAFGFLAFVGGGYDVVPSAWNMLDDAEIGTIQYEVLDVLDARRLRDCAQIQIVGDPERQMFVCNVSGELVRDLRPGEVIEATGPLSDYGHTFEQVRIVR